jgi:hypothetical protein
MKKGQRWRWQGIERLMNATLPVAPTGWRLDQTGNHGSAQGAGHGVDPGVASGCPQAGGPDRAERPVKPDPSRHASEPVDEERVEAARNEAHNRAASNLCRQHNWPRAGTRFCGFRHLSPWGGRDLKSARIDPYRVPEQDRATRAGFAPVGIDNHTLSPAGASGRLANHGRWRHVRVPGRPGGRNPL